MIRLESISISRFRGIREGKVEGFADVNLLIGRNNSGKSTVAEAITRVCLRPRHGQMDYIGRRVELIWALTRNEENPYTQAIWYNQDKTQPIELEAVIQDTASNNKLRIFSTIRAEPGQVRDDFDQAGTAIADSDYFRNNVAVFRILDALTPLQIQPSFKIENLLWQQLITNRRDKLLTHALNEIFRVNAEGIQLLPQGQLIVLFPEQGLPLDVQGDGTRVAIRCLMILALLHNTLFILEEPECFQHPGSLERFAETVCRRARVQQVQLLISTHSLECVETFLQAAKAVGSEGAVFNLKLEDGLLRSTKIGPDSVEAMEASGIDPRFLDLYG